VPNFFIKGFAERMYANKNVTIVGN